MAGNLKEPDCSIHHCGGYILGWREMGWKGGSKQHLELVSSAVEYVLK